MKIIKYITIGSLILGIIFSLWLLFLYTQIRFNIDSIVNYNPNTTTQIFDKNNKLIANIFKDEHRLYTKFEDIPARVIEGIIAIEDTQFFEHNGINIEAIIRAIIKDIKVMKLVEGASTITQQLVKTMVLSRDKKIVRKIKEAFLSMRLETILSKEEILERYLNQIYYGHGYYGIKTAAKGYFRKKLGQLSLKEIAILVGLINAPSTYDPTRNLNHALARGNQVIYRMNTLGWINQNEFELAIKEIPNVYDDTLTLNKAPYVVDSVIKQLQPDLKDIKYGGYKINLTIDLDAQKIARDALRYGYKKIIDRDRNNTEKDDENNTKTLNGAIIVIENSTGKILASVGGIDYSKSSFNRVTQSIRQPGSSIKPFIYQIALNIGYSTVTNLVDISRTYEDTDNNKTWKPKNYASNFKGIIKLNEALIHSSNLATINLVSEIGIDLIHKKLKYFEFKDIPMDLSSPLGSFGISPLKLSEQYTIFSNNGIKNKPYLISNLINSENETIYFDPQNKYITSKSQSYLITSMLKNVVKRGTGRRARVKNLEIAGKTGTTNNNKDAWFCAYSPTIQTVVWFGNDDSKPMQKGETGGKSAAPVNGYFYRKWLEIHPEITRKFKEPEGVFTRRIANRDEYFTNISKVPINVDQAIRPLENNNTKDMISVPF